mmetsp:Transcript_21185/g.54621  ORF Transcript_21185/g.54621 Transcript_21185/m.54621 type:complete len:231 (+) Transcript_21185:504-1196(+)
MTLRAVSRHLCAGRVQSQRWPGLRRVAAARRARRRDDALVPLAEGLQRVHPHLHLAQRARAELERARVAVHRELEALLRGDLDRRDRGERNPLLQVGLDRRVAAPRAVAQRAVLHVEVPLVVRQLAQRRRAALPQEAAQWRLTATQRRGRRGRRRRALGVGADAHNHVARGRSRERARAHARRRRQSPLRVVRADQPLSRGASRRREVRAAARSRQRAVAGGRSLHRLAR